MERGKGFAVILACRGVDLTVACSTRLTVSSCVDSCSSTSVVLLLCLQFSPSAGTFVSVVDSTLLFFS